MPRRNTARRTTTPTDRTAAATPDPREQAHAAFQARLRTGDFDAVLGRGLRRTLRAAAADQTLDLEVGALRLALARLLQEEDDTTKFAATVAQVARVALQAAAQRPGPNSEMDEIHTHLLRVLDEMDRKREPIYDMRLRRFVPYETYFPALEDP